MHIVCHQASGSPVAKYMYVKPATCVPWECNAIAKYEAGSHVAHVKSGGGQVRCIAAVLLMVGRGLEQPDVVRRMLDTASVQQKPQYSMAAEARPACMSPLHARQTGWLDLFPIWNIAGMMYLNQG